MEIKMKLPIYMDYHATTPVDPRVFEIMRPYFTEIFGNAASRSHSFGWAAEEAVEKARTQIASLINAEPREIVLTSGATESDNQALKGIAEMYAQKGDHIITQVTEHKAILDSAKALERKGVKVTYLPVDKTGLVDLNMLNDAITDKTILVSIMYANNEIGTVQPIAEIGKLCHDRGVLFHTDATQGLCTLPFDVKSMNIDLASFSAHKIYGPKGVGALYVRKKNPRVKISQIIDGGGHERGMRSGTLNVTGIVGFGAACEIVQNEREKDYEHEKNLRDKLKDGIFAAIDEVYLNGHPEKRLPNNLNISFAYVEGESLIMGIKDVAVSSGSACTSASLEPSYVLKALNVGEELAHSSIRFGLGRFNTEEEVDFVIQEIIRTVRHLRDLSPLYDMFKEGIDLKSVEWSGH
jgi:cysteine desulfurase